MYTYVLCKHLCYFHTNSIWFGMWPFVLAFLSCRRSVNLSKTPFTFAVVITGTASSFSLSYTIFAVINLVHCNMTLHPFRVQIKQLPYERWSFPCNRHRIGMTLLWWCILPNTNVSVKNWKCKTVGIDVSVSRQINYVKNLHKLLFWKLY